MGSSVPWWRILVCICIIIYLASGVSSSGSAFTDEECSFPALFAYGDSLTDAGNGQAVFLWQHAPTRDPYGITYFDKPVSRYSDGRLVIDLLAQAFGLPLLHPYLRNVGMNFRHGVNFATSGATVTNTTFLVPFNFAVQISWFERFQRKISEQPKNFEWSNPMLPNASDLSNALHMISIGGNDYDSALFAHNGTISQLTNFTTLVVSETLKYVRNLHQLGAKKFLIFNVPPVSCTPEFLVFRPPENAGDVDELGCYTIYNAVFTNHNNQLYNGIQTLRNELQSSKIVYVDYYNAMYDIAQNFQKYGFQNLTYACCGTGGQRNYDPRAACGDPGYTLSNGEPVIAKVCPDPNIYVSWDGIHPTEAVNKKVVKFIFNGTYVDPPDAFASCKLDFSLF